MGTFPSCTVAATTGTAPPPGLDLLSVLHALSEKGITRLLVEGGARVASSFVSADLVDEVWDDGNALLVKNRGQEQRIALADIKNVNYSPFVNPPRVTLSLRRPTAFRA